MQGDSGVFYDLKKLLEDCKAAVPPEVGAGVHLHVAL